MVDEIWPQQERSFTTASLWSTAACSTMRSGSILDVPIFRGGCETQEEEEDDNDEEQDEEFSDRDAAPAAAAVVVAIGMGSAAGLRSEGGATATRLDEPVHSAGLVGGGETKTPMRVRFALGEAGMAAAAATGDIISPTAAATGTSCREEAVVAAAANASSDGMPGFREGEEQAIDGVEGDLRSKIIGDPADAATLNVYGRGAAAASPPRVHRNSNNISPIFPAANQRWKQSMTADQLIALTTTSPQPHKPVRLFLHRSRPSLSSATATTAVGADGGSDGIAGQTGVGRASSVGSGNRQAFPSSWASINHSPMGLNTGINAQIQRGKATRASGDGRGILQTQQSRGTPTTSASAASATQWRQQQQQCRVDGTSNNNTNRLDYSPRWHSTSRRNNPENSSSGSIIGGGSNDENTPPPPPRVHARPISGREASLSLPAVRRNLAMVARQSKMGTKADPVTLYRQRQELEQKRIKNAAARNRRKTDHRVRSSGNLIWNTGQWVGGGCQDGRGHGHG